MIEIGNEEAAVLNELRERSDGTHEREHVDSDEYPRSLLREMALKRLVRLSGPGTGTEGELHAWITDDGIRALLAHERS